jgi:hypothetical protein
MTTTYEDVKTAILLGDLDADLEKLSALITSTLNSKRESRTPATYGIGDRVKFNSLCGTKYLQGHTAVVTGKARSKIIVKLERPTGRFIRMENGLATSVDIRVPPSIVDLVE